LIGIDWAAAKITTWRMPNAEEPYSGIWAKRYYDAGTKMASPDYTGAAGARIRGR
jgi:hypothetical protein